MSTSSTAVALSDLRRLYDNREVVRGISFDIRQGEIFGLLGPNGAGKTTTLSMISTRIRPTSGDAWVFGQHVVRDVSAVRRLVNVAPQEDALYPTLTAVENLSFFAELYGVESKARAARIAETLEAVGLTPRKDDRVNTYSGGMRRRLNLACALVSSPRLLLLDEPTASVDPQSRAEIYDMIRRLYAYDVTILYTTHYLEEAEELCDRIAIMDDGRVIALGTLGELVAQSGAVDVVELRLAHPPDDVETLKHIPHVDRVEVQGQLVRVYTPYAQEVLPALCSADLGQPIVRTSVRAVTLADVFLKLTGKELRDSRTQLHAR
jgi:ABC-2 type transport system ATP-binding protein